MTEAGRPSASAVWWSRGSFIGRLAPADRDALLRLGSREEYGHDERLLREGERSRHVLLVTKGRVRIVADDAGRYPCRLAQRVPGDLVGELAFLDDRPRSASVIATGPVLVRHITDRAFDYFLRRHPAAHRPFAQLLADRLRAADRRSVVASYDITARVAAALGDLAVPDGDQLVAHTTQRELAQLVGAAQVSVHRVLHRLAARQLIGTRHGSIVVYDVAALTRLLQ